MNHFGRIGAIFLGLAIGIHANAQTFSLFQVPADKQSQIEEIGEQFEIVAKKKDGYEVYVPLEKAKNFSRTFPNAKLLAEDADADWKTNFRSLQKASGYHDFDAVQTFLKDSESKFPKLAKLVNYGTSAKGYPLNYLVISSSGREAIATEKTKPKVFLDAATHGDELISTEVLLALTRELLNGYGNDERITGIIDGVDIYLSLVVNPDGFVNQNRYESWTDPNRSYPWPGDPDKKATVSIQALMKLFDEQKFQGAMTFHAYGKLLMYPWGYTYDLIEDEEDRLSFESLTENLALDNNYTHGPIASTIYVAKGSSADYYYWKYGTKALAVELSTSKVPPANRIPSVTAEAREMVWKFLESFAQ